MKEENYIQFQRIERSENRSSCLIAGLATLTLGFILSTPLLIGLAFHYDSKNTRELNDFLNSPQVPYRIGDDYHSYRNFGGPM